MRLIKPSFSIWDQQEGLEGIYKQIERAGRVCYKSEDKITEDSAKDFVDRMIKLGHGAMLEHGTIYLIIDCSGRLLDVANKYVNNKYSEWTLHPDGVHYCITTNYRVLLQNGWLDDLQYLCEPTEYHENRVTIHFVCDRGVSHEFVRHRVMSFAQESTRYCNYSKDKFGNEVTYILPNWIDESQLGNHNSANIIEECKGFENWADNSELSELVFLYALAVSEQNYFTLLNSFNWKPQEARAVLPNSLKTELVMTGFISDWKHFFDLRDAGSAHPQARELAHPLHMEFLRRGYIKDLYNEANPD